MTNYNAKHTVRYVHKIAPLATDTANPVVIPGNAFSNNLTLAKALRKAGILPKGTRIGSFRAEGNRTIVFPLGSVWHSVILTCE